MKDPQLTLIQNQLDVIQGWVKTNNSMSIDLAKILHKFILFTEQDDPIGSTNMKSVLKDLRLELEEKFSSYKKEKAK